VGSQHEPRGDARNAFDGDEKRGESDDGRCWFDDGVPELKHPEPTM
jgi:hypothetical protein